MHQTLDNRNGDKTVFCKSSLFRVVDLGELCEVELCEVELCEVELCAG